MVGLFSQHIDDGWVSPSTLAKAYPHDFNTKGCLSKNRRPVGRPYVLRVGKEDLIGL
ncbi:uncharacterized protein MYCGRDRAFT_105058 [Zymoseptoria tritici IPO323]|uniref:Uncharacterized protein n=1 Tax=Zymoseptoria tritici (strain CBS 115943 / IPO323) TaxID=336722 RepID=F9XEP4_ZYMTI|nr:uncharacterized protein MYCGRDRAFT_105058 [Zymoseptoria tritici IPO323]EGP86252.1 hypothetical protein MYCGRDRAFT_105058 [Zymoseptoria tritici IPO323]